MELIDATSNSLTVSWPSVPGAKRYVLQHRKDGGESSDDDFTTLTDKLTTTQARKKNLDEGVGHIFRVGAIKEDETEQGEPKVWITQTVPFMVLSKEQEEMRMAQPTVQQSGSNQTLLVRWTSPPAPSTASSAAVTGYELQMRENDGGVPWKTLAASLSGTEVRKKNLTSSKGYQFRVRPAAGASSEDQRAFSPASDAVVAWGLSDGMGRLFRALDNGTLLQDPKTPVPLADALGGKEFVLLYASAHWCGPCRQFTPQLTKWYQAMRNQVEVVFLSCDHDEAGFESYFSTMPWKAVGYEDDARENLLGYIRVKGIPRLVVLDGKTGRILVDNAVGQPLDVNQWRRIARGEKVTTTGGGCAQSGGGCC